MPRSKVKNMPRGWKVLRQDSNLQTSRETYAQCLFKKSFFLFSLSLFWGNMPYAGERIPPTSPPKKQLHEMNIRLFRSKLIYPSLELYQR